MSELTNLMSWGTTTLVSIPFLIVALVLFAIAGRGRGAANAAKSWATGSATIVSATIQARRGSEDGTSYYPYVVYEYEVNGQRYRNDKLHFGTEVGKGFSGWVQNDIAKYQPGSQHPFYYNPADPRQAVLERKAPSSNILMWVALFIVVMLLVSVGFTFGLNQFLSGMFSSFMP
jgi:hypothetical protein